MFHTHGNIMKYIQKFGRTNQVFKCQVLSSEDNTFKTEFFVPAYENNEFRQNREMVLGLCQHDDHVIYLDMGTQRTQLRYVHNEDIFRGIRRLNQIDFELTVRLIYLVRSPLLEIDYHRIDDHSGTNASHDGTIHPVP
ncbi:hypothetical protein ACFODZ_15985 [Marinicella sediminis]|uniref:Uncharacterized protein n=1 Tax=Marinicella sediminis TaxID=1792834 RepID=A0ABV7JI46_9GAMM|nr:hypothetical protein [Marinicella sediminis]